MTRCCLPLHIVVPALLPSLPHGAELALLGETATQFPEWRYSDCLERKGPTATEVYTSPGVERLTGPRFETAGENLHYLSVLMMRPRGNVFNVHVPDGGMRAVMDRTLK